MDEGNFLLEEIDNQCPRSGPQYGPEGVQHCKHAPGHVEQTGHDAVQLPQPVKEAGNEEDALAVTGEAFLYGLQMGPIEPDPFEEGTAAPPPYEVAHCISQNGGGASVSQDPEDAEAASRRIQGGGHEQGLSRGRNAEALDEYREKKGSIPVMLEKWLYPSDSGLEAAYDSVEAWVRLVLVNAFSCHAGRGAPAEAVGLTCGESRHCQEK